jgi:hypothetical protein
MQTPILGSSYVARSVNAADSRMVNLFPEVVPEGGKQAAFLNRAPGLRFLATVGPGPIRGLWSPQITGSDAYVVSGPNFYRITTSYTATLIGTVGGTGPVSISDNGTQIFIATNPDGYIYNMSTLAFAQITDPDFPGAATVGYLDGYFVFNEPDTQKVWVTSLLDGTSVDPLDFASTEGAPDQLISVNVDHREAWTTRCSGWAPTHAGAVSSIVPKAIAASASRPTPSSTPSRTTPPSRTPLVTLTSKKATNSTSLRSRPLTRRGSTTRPRARGMSALAGGTAN